MEGFKKLPKMQCFKTGGSVKAKAMCYGGKMKEGGKADIAQDKAIVKKAFGMHDKQEHPGEKTDLSKLKKGGRSKKETGTVRKYKDGGSVTNVYEAKKKSGDKDNIKNVKQITPTKAKASSAAGKGDNTVAKYNEGGALKNVDAEDNPGLAKLPTNVRNKMGYMRKGGKACYKEGGSVAQMGKPSGDKDKTIKTKMGPSKAATKSAAMKKGGAVKKYAEGKQVGATEAQQKQYDTNRAKYKEIEAKKDYEVFGSRGDAARKGMQEGRMDPMGTAYKKGGKAKVKKFAEGGFTAEEEKWLGGADRTDPIILARMRAALGEQKPRGSYIPNANPAMDNRDVGMETPIRSTDIARLNEIAQGQGVFPEGSPALPTSIAPTRRVPMPAGPSADDRLRMRNARPVQAPNVEQDSGVAYPPQENVAPNLFANRGPSLMQRFFNATPAEQAANFQRGVQARKNFGRTMSGETPSFASLLAALNKPKV